MPIRLASCKALTLLWKSRRLYLHSWPNKKSKTETVSHARVRIRTEFTKCRELHLDYQPWDANTDTYDYLFAQADYRDAGYYTAEPRTHPAEFKLLQLDNELDGILIVFRWRPSWFTDARNRKVQPGTLTIRRCYYTEANLQHLSSSSQRQSSNYSSRGARKVYWIRQLIHTEDAKTHGWWQAFQINFDELGQKCDKIYGSRIY